MTISEASQPALDIPAHDGGGLELEVCDVMSPGVVTISDDVSLEQAVKAIEAHRIRAILVVGSRAGTPLGWVTTRGLLGLIDADPAMPVTDAITEQVTAIEPSASVRSAIYALSLPGVSRLLVRRRGLDAVEGVITDFDLAVKARRLAR